MSVADPTRTRFGAACAKFGLLDEEALRACFEAIEPAKRVDREALERRLARKAAETGRLTPWQAQQVYSGHADALRIEKYVLLDRLAIGGMGRVYLARDVRLGRRVALKILTAERMNNPRAISRFEREVAAGAQLEHENLVRLYDGGAAADGTPFLVMEFVDGPSAGSLIRRRGRLDAGLAADLCRQVALGLEHAREAGMIHRDVHPWNILITAKGVAKLTDLGLVISQRDLGEKAVTRDGVTVGNFDYLSPEQARDSHDVDTRSDIYSLGCTLYHMVAGRVPFPTDGMGAKVVAHQLQEPDPPPADVPEGLAAVIAAMMKKRREERPATPLEVARLLVPYSVAPEPGWLDDQTPLEPAPISPTAAAATTVDAASRAAFEEPSGIEGSSIVMETVPAGTGGFSIRVDEEPLVAKLVAVADPEAPTRPSRRPVGMAERIMSVITWVILFAVALGSVALLTRDRWKSAKSPRAGDVPKASAKSKTTPASSDAAPAPNVAEAPAATESEADAPAPVADNALWVRVGEGGTADMFKVEDLREFVERAQRHETRRYTLLVPPEGTVFEAQKDEIRAFFGRMTIRPREPGRATVTIKLPGATPLLFLDPNATLDLERLDLIVEAPAASDTPIVRSYGKVERIDCTIKAGTRKEESLFDVEE